eukprot:2647377-Rhodomonas_salina.2
MRRRRRDRRAAVAAEAGVADAQACSEPSSARAEMRSWRCVGAPPEVPEMGRTFNEVSAPGVACTSRSAVAGRYRAKWSGESIASFASGRKTGLAGAEIVSVLGIGERI